jgi:hypothetical protein
MNNKLINQFEHENDSWMRSLEYMQMENVHLKNRLGQVIKLDDLNELLDQMEFYQNFFIHEDETIAMLRHDILMHNQRLKKFESEVCTNIFKIIKIQKKLRQDVELEEKKFNQLKLEFNNHFTKNLKSIS